MKERFDAAAIGTSYADEILKIDRKNFVNHKPGAETGFLGKDRRWGGSAPIFAQSFAALGHDIIFFGTVGKDDDGDFVMSQVKKSGITPVIYRPEGSITNSNVNFIFREDGEKHYFTNLLANANQQLSSKQVLSDLAPYQKQITYCYLAGGLKISDITRDFVGYFKENQTGIKLVVDHGRVLNETTREAKDTVKDLVAIADIYLPDEEELRGVWGVENVEDGFRAISDRSKALVVVKRGENGASFIDRGKIADVPVFPVEVDNPVGAGDKFNAGLLDAIMKGKSMHEAVRFAHATAALGISQDIFPAQAQVEEFLSKAA